MITVLPIKNHEELVSFYQAKNVSVDADSACVVAREDEKEIGYCLFRLTEKQAIICELSPSDNLSLADGILRSALHVAVYHGVVRAIYTQTAPEKLFLSLGFVLNKAKRELDVGKLFKKCCGCPDENT